MRQAVVIALIAAGTLLMATPLAAGAWEYATLGRAVARGGSVSVSVPWLEVYAWACFAAGAALIGLGLAGERRADRAPTARAGRTEGLSNPAV